MTPLREILVHVVLPEGTEPLDGDALVRLQQGVTESLAVAPVRLSVEQRDIDGEQVPTPDAVPAPEVPEAERPGEDPAAPQTPAQDATAPIPAEGAPAPGDTPIPGEQPAA